MLQSMTGFGRGAYSEEGLACSIVIRSINSKTADLSVKLPGDLKEWEYDVRKLLSSALKRGKIDLSVIMEPTGGSESSPINNAALRSNFSILKELTGGLKISEDKIGRAHV